MASDSCGGTGPKDSGGGPPFRVAGIQETEWHAVSDLAQGQLQVAVVRDDDRRFDGAIHDVVREATRVERLAYTRTQAGEALGISRSTFTRRVLPLLETIEMPWGARLIPVDELKRLLAEQRKPTRGRAQPTPPGRPASLPPEIVNRIRAERAAGKSLREIARSLNGTATSTAHGGAQWWPSTVRSVLDRSTPLTAAQPANGDLRLP